MKLMGFKGLEQAISGFKLILLLPMAVSGIKAYKINTKEQVLYIALCVGQICNHIMMAFGSQAFIYLPGSRSRPRKGARLQQRTAAGLRPNSDFTDKSRDHWPPKATLVATPRFAARS
ncbi:hypothetical protein NE619_16605 [Anaerovorax odorimutans]|uniref:Uncharacterized protein n=1 Tax=Anaerovorax odorimutans TaxID=109327 RepID=A0ABT1RT14_9FIRM|nr:hypothetical protein [Anaerovorax odorimutans]